MTAATPGAPDAVLAPASATCRGRQRARPARRRQACVAACLAAVLLVVHGDRQRLLPGVGLWDLVPQRGRWDSIVRLAQRLRLLESVGLWHSVVAHWHPSLPSRGPVVARPGFTAYPLSTPAGRRRATTRDRPTPSQVSTTSVASL